MTNELVGVMGVLGRELDLTLLVFHSTDYRPSVSLLMLDFLVLIDSLRSSSTAYSFDNSLNDFIVSSFNLESFMPVSSLAFSIEEFRSIFLPYLISFILLFSTDIRFLIALS